MNALQGARDKRVRITADEKLIIDRLLLPEETTRTTLARNLGVSPAWVTKIVTPLIKRGIVTETGAAKKSGGRRARTLGINKGVGYLLGVDFGATSLNVSLASPNTEPLAEKHAAIKISDGPEQCLGMFFSVADQLLDAFSLQRSQIRGIGVGVPGPVDFSRGFLTSPPIMPGWDNYPIPGELMASYPEAVVVVDNDVNLMALGELRRGEGQYVPNMIFLKLGSDIGAGIVCEGQIYRGSSGSAGDVGHIVIEREGPLCRCGNRGCLEALAGGMAIAAEASRLAVTGESPVLSEIYRSEGRVLTAVDVGAAAAQGDLAALTLVDQSGHYVGEMLTHLVSFFNPDLILIGGGVSKIGHRFLNTVRQVILQKASPLSTRDLSIKYSDLGERAGIVGALSLAQEMLFASPVE